MSKCWNRIISIIVCARAHYSTSLDDLAVVSCFLTLQVIRVLSRCVFKAIENLFEEADVIRIFRIYKARWLAHVDSLLKCSMEENNRDIELNYIPSLSDNNDKQNPYGWRFNDEAKSFIIIHGKFLGVILCYEFGFVPGNGLLK